MTIFTPLERIFGGIGKSLSVLAAAIFIVVWDSVLMVNPMLWKLASSKS